MAFRKLRDDEPRTAIAISLYYAECGPSLVLPTFTNAGNEAWNGALRALAARYCCNSPEKPSPIIFSTPQAPNFRTIHRLIMPHFRQDAGTRAHELQESRQIAKDWMEANVQRSLWAEVGDALGLRDTGPAQPRAVVAASATLATATRSPAGGPSNPKGGRKSKMSRAAVSVSSDCESAGPDGVKGGASGSSASVDSVGSLALDEEAEAYVLVPTKRGAGRDSALLCKIPPSVASNSPSSSTRSSKGKGKAPAENQDTATTSSRGSPLRSRRRPSPGPTTTRESPLESRRSVPPPGANSSRDRITTSDSRAATYAVAGPFSSKRQVKQPKRSLSPVRDESRAQKVARHAGPSPEAKRRPPVDEGNDDEVGMPPGVVPTPILRAPSATPAQAPAVAPLPPAPAPESEEYYIASLTEQFRDHIPDIASRFVKAAGVEGHATLSRADVQREIALKWENACLYTWTAHRKD